jgi:hypothetical protein
MPIASAAGCNYIPGGRFNRRLLAAKQTKAKTPFAYDDAIPFLVPRDTHAIFSIMEFYY